MYHFVLDMLCAKVLTDAFTGIVALLERQVFNTIALAHRHWPQQASRPAHHLEIKPKRLVTLCPGPFMAGPHAFHVYLN
jgi:hypothetical protein